MTTSDVKSLLTAPKTITVARNFVCITLELRRSQHIAICYFLCLPFGPSQSSFRLKKQSISHSAGCFSFFKSLLDHSKLFFDGLEHKLISLHHIELVSKILTGSSSNCGFRDSEICCNRLLGTFVIDILNLLDKCVIILPEFFWCFFTFKKRRHLAIIIFKLFANFKNKLSDISCTVCKLLCYVIIAITTTCLFISCVNL